MSTARSHLSEGTLLGTLRAQERDGTHDVVQGRILRLASGVSVAAAWTEGRPPELVCKVEPGMRVSVEGRRRTGAFLVPAGRASGSQNGRGRSSPPRRYR